MLHQIASTLDTLGLAKPAQAHCDIPCGIYDPQPALIAALSVIRLMDILHESENQAENPVALHNLRTRSTLRKEEEAEKVKHEIRVIWGDYFKGDLLKAHPQIHELAHSIMIKASACKQDVHREDAIELLKLVNQFAEAFWQSKNIETQYLTAPYPPNLPVVYPILK